MVNVEILTNLQNLNMKLYFKIIRFIKPYWKLVVLAVFLTFSYVFFNNISLWVSVDFIQEIFSPENIETNVEQNEIQNNETLDSAQQTTKQEAG